MAEDPDQTDDREQRAADLFDIRRIIGGLFLLYGVTLTVLGLGASDEDLQRAEGVNVNLAVGLIMIAMAAMFIGWALWRPLGRQLAKQPVGSRRGQAAATRRRCGRAPRRRPARRLAGAQSQRDDRPLHRTAGVDRHPRQPSPPAGSVVRRVPRRCASRTPTSTRCSRPWAGRPAAPATPAGPHGSTTPSRCCARPRTRTATSTPGSRACTPTSAGSTSRRATSCTAPGT